MRLLSVRMHKTGGFFCTNGKKTAPFVKSGRKTVTERRFFDKIKEYFQDETRTVLQWRKNTEREIRATTDGSTPITITEEFKMRRAALRRPACRPPVRVINVPKLHTPPPRSLLTEIPPPRRPCR